MREYIAGFLMGSGMTLMALASLAWWKGYLLIGGRQWEVRSTGREQDG